MDDRDELLVSKFFDENKIDVADNGFSRRVTRRLPDRERRLNRIWTAVCLALGSIGLARLLTSFAYWPPPLRPTPRYPTGLTCFGFCCLR